DRGTHGSLGDGNGYVGSRFPYRGRARASTIESCARGVAIGATVVERPLLRQGPSLYSPPVHAAAHRRRPARSTAIYTLATGLSQILFPIVALLGVSGIVVGILNSYEHFSVPALTPVFWNLAIIAGLVIGVPRAETTDGKLYVYAVSILIGTVIQVLLPFPWL